MMCLNISKAMLSFSFFLLPLQSIVDKNESYVEEFAQSIYVCLNSCVKILIIFIYSSRIICIRALVFKVSNSGLRIIVNTCVFISKVFVFPTRDFCVTGFNRNVIAFFPNKRICRTHVSIFKQMNNRHSSFAIIKIHDSPVKCLYCLPYRTLNHSGQQ